jgi:hypothetical protein
MAAEGGYENIFGTSFLFGVSTISTFAIVTLLTDTKIKTLLLGVVLLIIAHGAVGLLLSHNEAIGVTMYSFVEKFLIKLMAMAKEVKTPTMGAN